VTELIDVCVKKDLVRAYVVLLKGRCVSMVLVSEALGTPVAVDAAVADKTRRELLERLETPREGRGVSLTSSYY